MLKLLHRMAALPFVYDFIQFFFGLPYTRRRLRQVITAVEVTGGFVADVGGGTGVYRDLWSHETHYICLDNDPVKLHGFLSKFSGDHGLWADASHLPFQDNSLDTIFCVAVSHHLNEAELAHFFAEANRVLKPTGRFIFQDATWQPRRLPSRLLWSLDRGSHPRSSQVLQNTIANYLQLHQIETYAIYHRYILITGGKYADPNL